MPWVGAEIELRTESDETVVASCALPISITALCAMEKGLRSQYGSGLFMRQRGTILEFFKPSSADETAFAVQRVGRLCARWREEAAHLENSMDGQYPTDSEMAERANALRECAAALEAEWAGTEPTDGDQRLRRGEERAP
jgi:hypothetical protein